MRRTRTLGAAAGAALLLPALLAGCSSSDNGTAASPSAPAASIAQPGAPLPTGGPELADTKWALSGMATTTDDLSSSGITLEFAADTAGGSGGINTYTAGYTSSTDGTLTFKTIASTQMAGDEQAMKLESEYLTTLQKVTGYSVNGGLLDLFVGPDQMLTYTKQ